MRTKSVTCASLNEIEMDPRRRGFDNEQPRDPWPSDGNVNGFTSTGTHDAKIVDLDS